MTFVRRFGILILGGIVLALGVLQLAWSFVLEASFQFPWGASVSPTSTSYSPDPYSSLIAIALVILGVALAAGALGHRAGSRSVGVGLIRRYAVLAAGFVILAGIFVYGMRSPTATGEVLLGTSGFSGPGPLEVVFEPASVIVGNVIGTVLVAAAFGCIAWWIGAQLGRRRSRPATATS
jgi:hypothetical protein